MFSFEWFCYAALSKVGTDTFDETQATVTVPWNVVDVGFIWGYNSLTKTLTRLIRFGGSGRRDDGGEYPVKVGRGRPGLRPTVGYTIVRDSSRLGPGDRIRC
ncbi:MAG: hypothetical protein ACLU4N_02860 [Butyricimonas faecihominis]